VVMARWVNSQKTPIHHEGESAFVFS
jgi:hypothetical protein